MGGKWAMTFVHIGQVTQMKQARGFNIWFQDTNHTIEEREAKLMREHIINLCREFHYNIIDSKNNKKGLELLH